MQTTLVREGLTMAQDADLAAVVSHAAQDIGSFIRSQRRPPRCRCANSPNGRGDNPYLSQIEQGLRKPSAEVLSQIAKALRMSAEVLYVRAGILEPGQANQVIDAINADTRDLRAAEAGPARHLRRRLSAEPGRQRESPAEEQTAPKIQHGS